jgi:phage baseplate assembly protein gpV
LWNTLDRPPALLPSDAINKRIIRTPTGQQISFDDLEQSITISNLLQFELSLGPEESDLSSAGASVSLDIVGNVTITGAASITLHAPSITINGENVSISGSAGTTIHGGANCTILAGEINIG